MVKKLAGLMANNYRRSYLSKGNLAPNKSFLNRSALTITIGKIILPLNGKGKRWAKIRYAKPSGRS